MPKIVTDFFTFLGRVRGLTLLNSRSVPEHQITNAYRGNGGNIAHVINMGLGRSDRSALSSCLFTPEEEPIPVLTAVRPVRTDYAYTYFFEIS